MDSPRYIGQGEDDDEAYLEVLPFTKGTPGPGTYNLPSSFRNKQDPRPDCSYVLSTSKAPTIKGRHFLPDPSDPRPGPGPQQYRPMLTADSSHPRAGTMLFAVASRERYQRLYISPAFAVDVLGRDAPGPGTYRVGFGRRPGRAAPGWRNYGSATFGKGPQRAPPPREALAVPGPIYEVDTPATRSGPKFAGPVGPAHRAAHQARASKAAQAKGGAGKLAGKLPTTSQQQKAMSSTGGLADGTVDAAPAADTLTGSQATGATGQVAMDSSPKPAAAKLGLRPVTVSREGGSRWYGTPAIGDCTTPKSPVAVFGGQKIGAELKAKLYLGQMLTDQDPGLSDSPGPIYYPAGASMASSMHPGPRWSGQPRHPAAKEPYISREHAKYSAGDRSPGPAAYNIRNEARGLFVEADRHSGGPPGYINPCSASSTRAAGDLLGDGRSMKFGTGPRLAPIEAPGAAGPGPGAYAPLQGKLSTQKIGPSFSLGVDLRSAPGSASSSRSCSPGPGSCSPPPGVGSKGLPPSPAWSLGIRPEAGGIVQKNSNPGPGTYHPRGDTEDTLQLPPLDSRPADGSQRSPVSARRRGFSIAGKLPTNDETPSPGPGAYVVKEKLTQRYGGAAVVTSRTEALQYISPLHEQSQVGCCSPGPAAYAAHDVTVLSTHGAPAGLTFGTGGRSDITRSG